MAKLTGAAKLIAEELLAWDVARVDEIATRGYDVTGYRARQELAHETLAADVDIGEWPRDVRDLFMAVLEVNRTPTPAVQLGVRGPIQHPVPRRAAAQVRALKVLAKELNVIENLREVAPIQWADDEGGATR